MSKSARRRAREFALQGIYQWLLSGNSVAVIEQHMSQVAAFDKADGELFRALLRGAIGDAESLRTQLAPHLARSLEEVSPVEHALLLLAAHELKSHPETPYRVVINEAIELAKDYGGTDGHRFVNGVVDKLAADLRSVEVEAARRG
ncbi:MAG TPA: transcription antitermination factor NusB [Rhodocyclaceae bacterium]|nr:transcription antitermination factor NusB [Rhodocyclaceae bacterium]HNB79155.1 transcription antitermination factor NusB [Rhodocyclaceae bacterium]